MVVELLLSAALISGFKPLRALRVVQVLLGVFFIGVASAMFRGLDVPCGCFGPTVRISGIWAMCLEVFLFLVACLGEVLYTRYSTDGPSDDQHSTDWLKEMRFGLIIITLLVGGLLSRDGQLGREVGTGLPSPSTSFSLGARAPMLLVRRDGCLAPFVPTHLPALVVFVSPDCPWCAMDLDGFPDTGKAALLVVVAGSDAEFRIPVQASVIIDEDGLGTSALGVKGFPTYLCVGDGGLIEAYRVGSLLDTARSRSVLDWIGSLR
jgi:hypothetical protein